MKQPGACQKCGDAPQARRFDATCDLAPATGFKAPCAIKEDRRRVREAAEPKPIVREIKQDKRLGRRKTNANETRTRAKAA